MAKKPRKLKIEALGALLLTLLPACSSEEKLPARAGASASPVLRSGGPPQAGGASGHLRPEGLTIEARFIPPEGFERVLLQANSFSAYLRSLPLKPAGTKVRYFDGREKDPAGVYDAVVDLAVRPGSGQKVFLLAQSYLPAQDIQILKNPNDPALSPWYKADFEGPLITPEWVFEKTDLRKF